MPETPWEPTHSPIQYKLRALLLMRPGGSSVVVLARDLGLVIEGETAARSSGSHEQRRTARPLREVPSQT